MSNADEYYLNPIHARFAIEGWPLVGLDEFFELCDTLDEFDRHSLFTFVYPVFCIEEKEFITDEERMRDQYERLKEAAYKIPMIDNVVFWIIATQAMNFHRRWSDSSEEAKGVQSIKRLADIVRKNSEERARKFDLDAEEKQNNAAANVQLARQRYDNFCKNIIVPLMNMKPPMPRPPSFQ